MKWRIFLIIGLLYFISSCASSVKESRVESPDQLYSTNCIAVLPLENRTGKGMAGYRVAELVSSELISSRSFGVMEPVEALRTMQSNKMAIPQKYDIGKAVEVGRTFGVDGVVVGTLREFSFMGPFAELNEGSPVVSFELRLINTKNGAIVWSADIKSTGTEVTDVSKDYLVNFARSSVKEALDPLISTLGVRNIAMPCWKPKAPVVAEKPAQPKPQATTPQSPTPPAPQTVVQPAAPSEGTRPPAVPKASAPARIELVNASGNAKTVDNVGMTLLMNNHDLRKMSDQKTAVNATIINYRPGFEQEAGKIMVEIKKGKLQSKPDLPGDIDIQIILGKDLL
jgi:TolB-like protein